MNEIDLSIKVHKRFLALWLLPLGVVVAGCWVQFQNWRSAQVATEVGHLRDAYDAAREAGDFDVAVVHLDKLIDVAESENARDHWRIRRGILLYDAGRIDEAEAQFAALLDTSEADEVRRTRAVLYRSDGQPEKAKQELLAIPNPHSEDLTQLGTLQRPSEAIDSYTRALQQLLHATVTLYEPQKKIVRRLYGLRAAAHASDGNPDEALKDANSAIEMGDASGLAYATRATILALLERTDEAEADINRAIEIEGETEFNLLTKAKVKIACGDFPAARKLMEQCVEAFPEAKMAQQLLQLVRVGNGEGIRHVSPDAWRLLLEGLKEEAVQRLKP